MQGLMDPQVMIEGPVLDKTFIPHPQGSENIVEEVVVVCENWKIE